MTSLLQISFLADEVHNEKRERGHFKDSSGV